MNRRDARIEAENLLDKILKSQPNLMVSEHGHSRTNGVLISKFCSDFIDNYSEYLLKRQSTD